MLAGGCNVLRMVCTLETVPVPGTEYRVKHSDPEDLIATENLVIPASSRTQGGKESRFCSALGTRYSPLASPALRLGLRYVRGLREDAARH